MKNLLISSSGSLLSPSVCFYIELKRPFVILFSAKSRSIFQSTLWISHSVSCCSLHPSSLAFLCSLILLCSLHSFSLSFPPQDFCTHFPFAQNSCLLLTYSTLHCLCTASSEVAFIDAFPWLSICGPLFICLLSSGFVPYVAFFSLKFYSYVID